MSKIQETSLGSWCPASLRRFPGKVLHASPHLLSCLPPRAVVVALPSPSPVQEEGIEEVESLPEIALVVQWESTASGYWVCSSSACRPCLLNSVRMKRQGAPWISAKPFVPSVETQSHTTIDLEFFVDVVQVDFDRALTDAQGLSDALITYALRHQAHNL